MRTSYYPLMMRLTALVAVLVAGGCVSSDMSDLTRWIDEVKGRPGSRIQPLPEIKPYEAFTYVPSDRDPFESFYRAQQPAPDQQDPFEGCDEDCQYEVSARNREELEQFELDSLRMVGIMENEMQKMGIIADPTGNVQFVKIGNYMGRNVGKIVNIFEDRIELREIIRNDQGRWEEREARIALVEAQ